MLGAKRKNLAGYSTASVQPHQGFVWQSEIVQQTPPAFRKKAAKVVGSKCTLLARMDAYGQDPTGGAGEQMKVRWPSVAISMHLLAEQHLAQCWDATISEQSLRESWKTSMSGLLNGLAFLVCSPGSWEWHKEEGAESVSLTDGLCRALCATVS